MSVIEEVAAERKRQIEVEGWTPEHDDTHTTGRLASAAAVYAAGPGLFQVNHLQVPTQVWPYFWNYKPKTRRRDLVRAAALIVAEIERLDRQESSHGRTE